MCKAVQARRRWGPQELASLAGQAAARVPATQPVAGTRVRRSESLENEEELMKEKLPRPADTMPSGSKRARDAAAETVSISPATSAALRAALAARCGDDSPPGAWRAVAAAAGVYGADAFLVNLGHSVVDALQSVPANAEAARAQLRSTRVALHSAVDSRCDELEARINESESIKVAALEHELCAINAVLEKLRDERVAAADAATTMSDSEFVAEYAELTARLDAAEAQLLALPTTVVEPTYVGLVIDESTLLAGIAAFGRVVAPRAVTAADLTLKGAPIRAHPGRLTKLIFTIYGEPHSGQSAEELEVSLGAAAAAAHVEASLKTEGAPPQPLQVHASVDVSTRCIVMLIVIPATAAVGSSVCFGSLTVSGQPLTGSLGALQVEFPPGGSSNPGAWEKVYRATTHGFGAAAFHARCDGRARLLVLVRAREGGWLFGGFTSVGFSPPADGTGDIADPSAFIFSLTNSLGRPEKLESMQTEGDLFYGPSISACFGGDFGICDNADRVASSYTATGGTYAASASTGTHPMSQGLQQDWLAAEVVAWVV